jgi:hypothetical protein
MKLQCLVQLDMLLQVTGITPGRAAALLPVGLGLISLIIGWWALRSTRGIRNSKFGAITSLILSIISIVLSGTHLIRTTGSSIGTGSGRLGAFVALILGMIGIILGGIALVRSRKNALGNGKEKP